MAGEIPRFQSSKLGEGVMHLNTEIKPVQSKRQAYCSLGKIQALYLRLPLLRLSTFASNAGDWDLIPGSGRFPEAIHSSGL